MVFISFMYMFYYIPKYNEIVFRTTDLPVKTVDLVWKFNASKIDNSLAGVIVPQPNKLRVSGEKGFVLNKWFETLF